MTRSTLADDIVRERVAASSGHQWLPWGGFEGRLAVVASTARDVTAPGHSNLPELPMDTPMPTQKEFVPSAMRRRSVAALILLSTTLLSVLDSGAEVKSPPKKERSFSAAHCQGSVAKTEWTLTDANSPTPACLEGNSGTKGVLNFDADEVQGAIVPFTLPGQFTGKLHVTLTWQAASASRIGSVGWCVELVTGTDLNRGGGAPVAHTARHCASDQVKKSSQHLNTALVITVAAAPSATNNDVLHVRIRRDANSSVVLDDMPGDAYLIGVVIETEEGSPRAL